jgi:hypothetical protein
MRLSRARGSLDVVSASDERRTVKTRTAMLAAVLALLLLAVAAVASGCGSTSSEDGGVAALDNASDTTSETEEGDNANEDPEEAALAWAKCMRKHGVDVPDPQFDNGRLTIRAGARGRRLDNIESEKFQKAQEECGEPFGRSGGPPISDEEREELQEAMLAFAKCMREHGVDMPDPEFSGQGGGVQFRAGGPGGGVDPNGATFRKAEEACGDILEDARPDGGRLGRSTGGESE